MKSDQRNEEDFTEAKPETITEIHQKVEHAFFEDISYFYKASDIIIVGTVLAKETERINKTELGLINAEDDYYDTLINMVPVKNIRFYTDWSREKQQL